MNTLLPNYSDTQLFLEINSTKAEIDSIEKELLVLCSLIGTNIERLNLAKSTLIDLESELERRSKKKK
ncbi:hypothetical protein [Melioribacter sp. OK-6-Me]|uniref:hypothetical protein n=1 Tax=unclassified Melioribacter TaxID=2627329 RepID=UPI003ED860A6